MREFNGSIPPLVAKVPIINPPEIFIQELNGCTSTKYNKLYDRLADLVNEINSMELNAASINNILDQLSVLSLETKKEYQAEGRTLSEQFDSILVFNTPVTFEFYEAFNLVSQLNIVRSELNKIRFELWRQS